MDQTATATSSSTPADQPYHLLEDLAREIWRWAIVCSGGTPEARLSHLARWLDALKAGHLPGKDMDLGEPGATGAMRDVIRELELTQMSQGSDSMALQILQSMLWHLDSLIDRPAAQSREAAIADMKDLFKESWNLQRQGWEEALALLKSLGDTSHWRWDDLQGQLNRREWSEAQRIGEMLEKMPQLTHFINQVGRRKLDAHLPKASVSQSTQHHAPPASQAPAEDEERQPEPTAVDGVRLSRTLERMLGSESACLTHPVWRRLWRARFAEARLLAYDDRARIPSPLPQPWPEGEANERDQRSAGHGPMIICLDTSGSMQGAPENVAKACVLQALRIAHSSDRRCLLLSFGGPGELLQKELSRDAAGLDALLDTMGQSFDGGTDVQTPIERAILQTQQEGWQDADVLIVSDGEFGLTHEALDALRAAKDALALRVHGILIGDRETIGLIETCDHLHWVRDWRRYGAAGVAGAQGFSPVHARNLTALYFPNAIRH
ncbi:VWA domain-containing protein [Hydrogenophaga sp. 5NK40-0174]|uniref:VWA domain-containing protein n=1 Tax=Hydrogenophaga sp. 5NK40-0174 TaxID=3127649 RepID=UPI00310B0CDC